MIIEQFLGLIGVITGLVLLLLTVSYTFTIGKELPKVTRIAGGIILLSLGISFLVSGFPLIGGALSGFAESPSSYVVLGVIIILCRVVVIVSGITGIVAVINQRRKK